MHYYFRCQRLERSIIRWQMLTLALFILLVCAALKLVEFGLMGCAIPRHFALERKVAILDGTYDPDEAEAKSQGLVELNPSY